MMELQDLLDDGPGPSNDQTIRGPTESSRQQSQFLPRPAPSKTANRTVKKATNQKDKKTANQKDKQTTSQKAKKTTEKTVSQKAKTGSQEAMPAAKTTNLEQPNCARKTTRPVRQSAKLIASQSAKTRAQAKTAQIKRVSVDESDDEFTSGFSNSKPAKKYPKVCAKLNKLAQVKKPLKFWNGLDYESDENDNNT